MNWKKIEILMIKKMTNISKIPVLSLWQPWAQFVCKGWKTIETRNHDRFGDALLGKRILIHAAAKWDDEVFYKSVKFLGIDEMRQLSYWEKLEPQIICSAYVGAHGGLDKRHSKDALIDCDSVQRYGLHLEEIYKLENPIMTKGKQGIWYLNIYPITINILPI